MRRAPRAAVVVAVAALAVGAIAYSGGASGSEEPSQRRAGVTVKARGSAFGKVLFTRSGRALYLFTRDRRNRTRCFGGCARAWPPLLTRGSPRAGRGVKARLLGTIRRRNGKRQVTYRGHPLYKYVNEGRNQIRCQDVASYGGRWYVVSPRGAPVR